MRGETWIGCQASDARDVLLLRGGALRTFGGLAIFTAAVLLSGGSYLLAYVITNPLGADCAIVLTSATALTIAAILLYYLAGIHLKTIKRSASPREADKLKVPCRLTTPRAVVGKTLSGGHLPFQRSYVDPVRIRP